MNKCFNTSCSHYDIIATNKCGAHNDVRVCDIVVLEEPIIKDYTPKETFEVGCIAVVATDEFPEGGNEELKLKYLLQKVLKVCRCKTELDITVWHKLKKEIKSAL